MDEGAVRNGFALLDIRPDHAMAVTHLPFHHRDAFDRLLIAQALIERLTIVSSEAALDAYPVERIW